MTIFKGVDYGLYTLPELRELAALIATAAIPEKERAKKQEGIAKAHAVMKEFNVTLAELHLQSQQTTPRPKVPMKYQNPLNPAEQWSGRGRAPSWMLDAEAAGRSRLGMQIPQQGA